MDDPAPIRDVLDQVLRRFGVAQPVDVAQLVSEWDEKAGEPWAGRSRPASLEGGELVVEAFDGSSASLLRYQVADLVRRLDEVLGQGLVTSVRVRVARPRRDM
jgi:hypothetical protein